MPRRHVPTMTVGRGCVTVITKANKQVKNPMDKVLRILVVDDQRRTRQSLTALLATQFQQIEVREAENGVEAIRCAEKWNPDLVLMDARMPALDGVTATRVLKRQAPQVKVVILSMYPEYLAAAL